MLGKRMLVALRFTLTQKYKTRQKNLTRTLSVVLVVAVLTKKFFITWATY
jgi:hypothetical protein